MERKVEVAPGTNIIAPGWTAKVTFLESYRRYSKKSTAFHEAVHAVLGVDTGAEVIEVSVVPGPGYRGRTRLGRFSATSFMGPHSVGCDGTGHDVGVVVMMGHDQGAAASAARSIIAYRDDEIHAVADKVQTKGTISGSEVKETMDKVANPEVNVEITDPLGNIRHFVTKVRKSKGHILSIGIPEPIKLAA